MLYLLTRKEPCRVLEGYPCSGDLFHVPIAPRPPAKIEGVDDEAMEFLRRALDPDPANRFCSAAEALSFLNREKTTSAGLVFKLKGKSVKVDGDLMVGRSDDPKVDVVVRGGRLEIYDPNKYISREHLEVKFMGGEPYVRDLGSVNGTAIYRGGDQQGAKEAGRLLPPQKWGLNCLGLQRREGALPSDNCQNVVVPNSLFHWRSPSLKRENCPWTGRFMPSRRCPRSPRLQLFSTLVRERTFPGLFHNLAQGVCRDLRPRRLVRRWQRAQSGCCGN